MRKTTKRKLQNPVESNGGNVLLPTLATSTPTLTKEECKERIVELIDSGRRSALEVVTEMMCITFEEVVDLLMSNGIGEDHLLEEKMFLSNVSTYSLSSMLTEFKKGSLRNFLLGKSKPSLVTSFLDLRALSKEALQSEFQKAFEKWTIEEEMILTGMYNEGRSWKEMSEHLQRNVNAIKIRVEKLGLASDTGAKKRF